MSARERGIAEQRDNRAKRDKRREVGVLDGTEEAGEVTRATLRREASTWIRNRKKERWERHGITNHLNEN